MEKKLFRCNVCNDIHFGLNGPTICPTCNANNAYVKSTIEEAKKIMNI